MDQFIVTETCSTLRELGREALRGKWKLAFFAYMVYYAVIYIPLVILMAFFKPVEVFDLTMYGMYFLFVLLIAGPLTLGCSIFALSIFRNEEASIGQIFYGFERFGKALGLALLVTLFVILWFLIPVAGLALGVIAAFKYSQVFFIMADNPDIGIVECIARSKHIMDGNKAKLFVLELTFIGWGILASIPTAMLEVMARNDPMMLLSPGYHLISFVLSAGFMFLMAYVMVTTAGFYEMASGLLRPGVIATTAEIVEEKIEEKIEENAEDER